MIKKDKYKMIMEEKLNKAELKAFVRFLLHERDRHIEDIAKIDRDVNRLSLSS